MLRIITNSVSTGWYAYFYDQAGHPIAEYDGISEELIREFVWLGDAPIAVIEAGTTPTTYYIHTDHIGRPMAITDAGGSFVNETDYVAFGNIWSSTGTVGVDLRFPGQMYQHETGLFYNWNRSYDPTIARYTQPDPLGLVDGSSRYAYVGSDPLQKVDPSGRFAFLAPLIPAIPGILSGIAGAVTGAITGAIVWPMVVPNEPSLAETPGICEQSDTESDNDCAELYAKIYAVTSELAKRYSELIRNELKLPDSGPFSVDGHRQQLRNQQRRLRRLLDEANAKGCTGYSPEAWFWATIDTPYPGWGGSK